MAELRPVKIALLVSGHTRHALQKQSELSDIQQLLKHRFGTCDVFGIFPVHTETTSQTWYSISSEVKVLQQEEIGGLCDFTFLRFYNDQLLFPTDIGKWGSGVRSMWWAIQECFHCAESQGAQYDWYIRLRPDNYKWGSEYTERLLCFLETFDFRHRSPRLVSVSPKPKSGDDICFVAPPRVFSGLLRELKANFHRWSQDERVAHHPEFVVPLVCNELGVSYDLFRFRNGHLLNTLFGKDQ